jgi:hypothetical protein
MKGMRMKGWILLPGCLAAILLIGLRLLLGGVAAVSSDTVSGVVMNADGPLAGARVRVRATENLTFTDIAGHFTLTGTLAGQQIEVSAWYTGHYISSTHVTPPVSGITITLRPYHTTDHPGYAWSSPISGTSTSACGNCHPMIISQWISNAHGSATFNSRFYSLYNGTDLTGTLQVGPGYLNDFPGKAGSCANCHAPAAGIDGYLSTNMNTVRGAITETIHCDFCHKVGGVYLNPATQSVYANAPGAQSQRVLRPPPGDNIFFGPYDDIEDPDTYLPLVSESAFCAPCHQFSFWGTPVYESYQEWLSSPYAAMGVTCQKCHMPPNGDTYFALPQRGGLAHPPEMIPSHLQRGAADVALLQETATMSVRGRFENRSYGASPNSEIEVTVTISNTGAGHHVPTDFPGRHMILVITATDSLGAPLPFLSGPTVPVWGGAQAGLPGTAFAKILRDARTAESPVVSYWRQALIASDNRIPALAAESLLFRFTAPAAVGQDGDVQISARLLFRRIFQDVADQKGWDDPDIVMEEGTWLFSPSPAAE